MQTISQEEKLLEAYKPLVLKLCGKFFLPGGDRDDLIQEGMIGLYKAIRSYDPSFHQEFGAYARICIEHQLSSAVKISHRKKNRFLNEARSFQEEVGQEDEEGMTLLETLPDPAVLTPEEILLGKEEEASLENALLSRLSKMEKMVFLNLKKGFTYKEIALILQITPKSCDNAIQRIKNKSRQILEESHG